MTLADRLKQAMKEAGLSQPKLAQMTGTTQQNIFKVIAGITKHPKNMLEIAKAVDKPVEWLLYGVDVNYERHLYTLPLFSPVTVLAYCLSANNDALIISTTQEKIVMSEPGYEKCYAVTVNEDLISQPDPAAAQFSAGDTLIVDSNRKPESNDVVLAYQNGAKETFFKRYVIDGIKSYLFPLKPQLPTIEINDTIQIFGVVVAKAPPLMRFKTP